MNGPVESLKLNEVVFCLSKYINMMELACDISVINASGGL